MKLLVVGRDDLLLMNTPPPPVKDAETESNNGSSEPSTGARSSLDRILNCTPSDALSTVCSFTDFLHIYMLHLNRT